MMGAERAFVSPKILRALTSIGKEVIVLDSGAILVLEGPPDASVSSCPEALNVPLAATDEGRTLVGASWAFHAKPPVRNDMYPWGYVNSHVPEYPGCTPSWLITESNRAKHLFKHSSKTGIKAAKRAAKKRRRSKKS